MNGIAQVIEGFTLQALSKRTITMMPVVPGKVSGLAAPALIGVRLTVLLIGTRNMVYPSDAGGVPLDSALLWEFGHAAVSVGTGPQMVLEFSNASGRSVHVEGVALWIAPREPL